LATKQYLFDMRRIGHHDEDDVGVLRHLGGTLAGLGAGGQQRLRHAAARLGKQFVAGGQQVAGHGRAHDAQPDESQFHECAF
jgi:hypothetical protein